MGTNFHIRQPIQVTKIPVWTAIDAAPTLYQGLEAGAVFGPTEVQVDARLLLLKILLKNAKSFSLIVLGRLGFVASESVSDWDG